jgi:cytochrome c oxidase assembly protein subunit 15
VFLFLRNKKFQLGFDKTNWVIAIIGIEVLTGMAMYYLNFPFATQPLHLVIASLLFGTQTYLFLETKEAKPSK